MLEIIITAFIILHITVAKDIVNSTSAKNSIRSDNDILKELLRRMEQMEKNVNMRFDQQDVRFDRLENYVVSFKTDVLRIKTDVLSIKTDVLSIKTNVLSMESNNDNMSVVMETIVKQQRVITAEIFTVSQTLPFCCCQYQNTINPEEVDSTTTATAKIETTTTEPKKSYCAEAMGESGRNGVYKIHIRNSGLDPFDVYCLKSVDNKKTYGTWMIIQRRKDNYTDFYKGWNSYKLGFGDLNRSFWIGLDKLYALTNSAEQEFWVQLELNNGTKFWGTYSNFAIGNETELYAIKTLGYFKCSLDGYGDNALSDGMEQGVQFSTYDNDNDEDDKTNCGEYHRAGWWFETECGWSNINGVYGITDYRISYQIRWHPYPIWSGEHLSYVHVAIRPRQQKV